MIVFVGLFNFYFLKLSLFKVYFILPINAFVVCSVPLSFFFSKLTMNTDKEKTLWAKYLKLKN